MNAIEAEQPTAEAQGVATLRTSAGLGDWQPISTAPLDGRVILVRCKKFPNAHAMGWSSVRKRWEGMAYALMRAVPTWWDETAEQPDQWREVA
jgi:hypothetical protein